MPLDEVLKYEKQAEELKVSKVARSKQGFLTYYKNNKNLNDAWVTKRDAFISRHLAQYEKKPTERRKLALIMWAYKPK